jgi:hypothetical protein
MDSYHEELKASQQRMIAKMDAWLEGTNASREVMEACQEKTETRIDTSQAQMEAEIKTGLEKVMAMDLEASPGEVEVIAELQKVPDEATVETIGALEESYGDLHLAIGCRQQLKKWTQSNGGSQQKLVASRRLLTHCAIPELCMGRGRRGPGKTLGNMIRGRSTRQELHLGSKEIFYKALGQTFGLDVFKRAPGYRSFIAVFQLLMEGVHPGGKRTYLLRKCFVA